MSDSDDDDDDDEYHYEEDEELENDSDEETEENYGSSGDVLKWKNHNFSNLSNPSNNSFQRECDWIDTFPIRGEDDSGSRVSDHDALSFVKIPTDADYSHTKDYGDAEAQAIELVGNEEAGLKLRHVREESSQGDWDDTSLVSIITESRFSSKISIDTTGWDMLLRDKTTEPEVAFSLSFDDSSLFSQQDTTTSSTVAFSDYSFVDGRVPCKRCTFLNEPGSTLCSVCEFALKANPNTNLDALIARQMQSKEDENASENYLRGFGFESGVSLFSAAQRLTFSILAFAETRKLVGFSSPQRLDLLFLVSNWLSWKSEALVTSVEEDEFLSSKCDQQTWICYHIAESSLERDLIPKCGIKDYAFMYSRLPELPGTEDEKAIWLCAVTLGRSFRDFFIKPERQRIIVKDRKQCLPLMKVPPNISKDEIELIAHDLLTTVFALSAVDLASRIDLFVFAEGLLSCSMRHEILQSIKTSAGESNDPRDSKPVSSQTEHTVPCLPSSHVGVVDTSPTGATEHRLGEEVEGIFRLS